MIKKAFTLVEVLITLVIIGVIAAITIGIISNNTNNNQYRTALKKAISVINQAIVQHYALEGLSVNEYETSSLLVNDLFKKRMNIFNDSREFTDNVLCPSENNGENVFVTIDGIIFCITNWAAFADEQDKACNSLGTKACAEISTKPNLYIDVNGDRKPNKYIVDGDRVADIYAGLIFNNKVLPMDISTLNMLYGNENMSLKKDNKNPNNEENIPEEEPTPSEEEEITEEEPEEECDPEAHCISLYPYYPALGKDCRMCNTSCPYKKQCSGDGGFANLLPAGMCL